MVESTEPVGVPGAPTDPPALYKSGPWLIVYGAGPESEDAAAALAEQCAIALIDFDLVAVDEAGHRDLGRYFGLIAVLPYAPGSARDAFAPYAEIISSYRGRHPYGLRQLLAGQQRWFDVGVVQVVGTSGFLQHPRVRKLRSSICVSHDVGAGVPDVIGVYSGRGLAVVADLLDVDEAADPLAPHWKLVQEWGIRRDQIPGVRASLEDLRTGVENNARACALHRPVAGVERTALDLILDGDWADYEVLQTKTGKENFARVQRQAVAAMTSVAPGLARPARGGFACKDLHELYLALRILDDYQALIEPDS